MSKRNSIILIFLMVVVVLVGLLYFYFRTANTGLQTQNTFTPETPSSPFGNNSVTSGNTNGSTSTATTTQTQTAIKNTAKLIEIYKNPTAGTIFFTNVNNQNDLRFVDRGNGNTYEYLPDAQTGQAIRLTNTTIPKIQESVWSATGKNLFLRYLDGTNAIVSFSALINISSTSDGTLGNITGTFISPNIQELVTDPKGDKAFGLFTNSSGSYGDTFGLSGLGKKQIFTSPVSGWNISWPNANIITLTTKPTYRDYGYLYFLNTQTQNMDRILGDMPGLSTVTNADASLVAYSQSIGNSFNLDIFNVKSKSNEGYTISTLADKCVWGNTNTKVLYCAVPQIIPEDTYPDSWYQGIESFSDNIWMIDTTNGATTLVYQIGLKENVSIDAMDLHMSPDDDYISFTNKDDLSLWLLQIQ